MAMVAGMQYNTRPNASSVGGDVMTCVCAAASVLHRCRTGMEQSLN